MFGEMSIGQTEELHGEHIATVFFVLLLPIAPLGSYYVVDATVKEVRGFGETRRHERFRGFRVGFHAKSILLGYLVGAAAAAFMFGAGWLAATRGEFLWVSVVAFALSAILYVPYLLGRRARGVTRRQREVLGQAAGIHALPRWLPVKVCQEILAKLEAEWAAKSGGQPWTQLVTAGKVKPASYPLVYALACYTERARSSEAARLWAEHIWELIEAGPQAAPSEPAHAGRARIAR